MDGKAAEGAPGVSNRPGDTGSRGAGSPRRPIAAACASFVVANLAILALVVSDKPEEISPAGVLFLGLWTCVVLAAQLGLVLLVVMAARPLTRQGFLERIVNHETLLSGILASNFYFSYLVLKPELRLGHALVVIGVLACGLLTVAVRGGKIDGRVYVVFLTVGGTLLLTSVIRYGASYLERSDNSAPADFESVTFVKKPNVYVISFDGLGSDLALERFFGVTEPAHTATLRAKGFRVIADAFSAAWATRQTFTYMFALSPRYARRGNGIVEGRHFNPTYHLFGSNGYKVQAVFWDDYLGFDRREIEYFFPQRGGLSACWFVPETFLYGACSRRVRRALRGLLGSERLTAEAQVELLVNRIEKANAEDDAPWLSISHIYTPAHAPGTLLYDNSAERNAFVTRYVGKLDRVNDIVDELVTEILTADPNPIIVIHSDHGAWLSRGLPIGAQTLPADSPYTRDEILMDRFSVFMAIYPASRCADYFGGPMSTMLVFRRLVQCLSGGRDPLGAENTNVSYWRGRVVIRDGVPVR